VERATSVSVSVAGGALGSLIYGAFAPLRCKQCGPISKQEFPPQVQREINQNSVLMILGAVVLLAVVIGLLVLIQTWQ